MSHIELSRGQKYCRLRCLLHVKGLVICFHLGWSGSILQFRQNIIKVGSKSWLLTCSSNITLSLPSYTGSALKRELNFCNGYFSLLYFCLYLMKENHLFSLLHILETKHFCLPISNQVGNQVIGYLLPSSSGFVVYKMSCNHL